MAEGSVPNANRIQAALAARGVGLRVVELPASTRTAVEAAAAIGCTVAQIAKSIVFRTVTTERPILVVASGPNRVDESLVGAAIGEPIAKADGRFVRDRTGFAIGGVPPLGHIAPIHTIIDRELLAVGDIWAAAGTPNSVFRLTGALLVELTGGTVMAVTAS